MYKITLDSGHVIDNLILNGNNYVSETEIDDSHLQGILNEVVIENEDQRLVYEKLKLISHMKVEGVSWLVFGEPSSEEVRNNQIDSRFETVEQEQEVIITVLADIMGV
jgi:hypothetical protein